MRWHATFGDVVTVGDEVALSLLGHPEARGVIVGAADDGRAVVSCGHCAGALTVEELNLAALLRRGGDDSHAC